VSRKVLAYHQNETIHHRNVTGKSSDTLLCSTVPPFEEKSRLGSVIPDTVWVKLRHHGRDAVITLCIATRDLLEFGIQFMIDIAFGVQDSSLRECMLVALLQETNAEPISATQTIKRRRRPLLLPPRVATETRIQSLK
jgi:hypothetical protein